jgi:hypothetical protein
MFFVAEYLIIGEERRAEMMPSCWNPGPASVVPVPHCDSLCQVSDNSVSSVKCQCIINLQKPLRRIPDPCREWGHRHRLNLLDSHLAAVRKRRKRKARGASDQGQAPRSVATRHARRKDQWAVPGACEALGASEASARSPQPAARSQ